MRTVFSGILYWSSPPLSREGFSAEIRLDEFTRILASADSLRDRLLLVWCQVSDLAGLIESYLPGFQGVLNFDRSLGGIEISGRVTGAASYPDGKSA